MKQITITNDNLKNLIVELDKKSAEKNSMLLKRIADDLKKPRRIRREVNLSRINQNTVDGETIVVPGKVLGGGELDHKVTILAFNFSQSAVLKIEKNGSKIMHINKIIEQPIDGKRIRIIG
jgi:large subunit ribosomal protein L18e